jgi:hypothetical protein
VRILTEPGDDRGQRSSRRGIVVLIAAALLAVAAGAWWMLQRPPSRPEPGRQAERAAKPTPRPAPVPGAVTGTVEIDSQPGGASVTVDGRALGDAPQRVELRGGSHEVRVRKDGFEPFSREVHVVPGHTLRISAQLTSEAARLRVDSDVPGATVFLDRKPFGKTPLDARAVTPGSHRLNVTADGYEMYSDTIEITSGTHEVMVRFKEVRLDEALDVVHKHGMGSCRGRLVATVEGLRYETADANDGFRASFSALDPLQMDYLEKNLRVKLKGGKTYNFTGDSADALLSFRNAVEAARKRL